MSVDGEQCQTAIVFFLRQRPMTVNFVIMDFNKVIDYLLALIALRFYNLLLILVVTLPHSVITDSHSLGDPDSPRHV